MQLQAHIYPCTEAPMHMYINFVITWDSVTPIIPTYYIAMQLDTHT